MSATKRYWETVSEREGYGGELSEEFLDRVQAGEFRDTLLVIDRHTGQTERFHQTDPEFRRVLELFDDGLPDAANDEVRLRAGEVLVTCGNVRLMVCGGLAG